MDLQWLRMALVRLRSFYLDFLWHDSLSVELELEIQPILGLISWLQLPNAGQSDPLCGGAGCGWWFLHVLPNAGRSDSLGRGAGCGYFLHLLPNVGQSDPFGGGATYRRFLLPHQQLNASEMWISSISALVDYLVFGKAHLCDLFPRHIPQLLVIQICWYHCFYADTTCVYFFLHRTPLLIGLSPSEIRDPISSTMSLNRVCSLPSCRALTLGQTRPGGIELQEWVYWCSIWSDIDCRERLDTIFCCSQHCASVCQIHASSRMAFCTVLYSHHGLFVSDLHLLIFDWDRLRY